MDGDTDSAPSARAGTNGGTHEPTHITTRAGGSKGAAGPLGLTKFAFQLMDKRTTITELHHATDIPVPTLSMYKNGHRSISHYHQPILAIALNLPISAIVGYVDTEVLNLEVPERDLYSGI